MAFVTNVGTPEAAHREIGYGAWPLYRRAVIAAMTEAFDRRDAMGVAELVHPEAEVSPLPARVVLRGRDEVIAYIEMMERRTAAVRIEKIEDLGADALLINGREQWQDSDYTILDMPVVWVVWFKERLIWRTRAYRSRAQAIAAER
jgi:hypothetical protein